MNSYWLGDLVAIIMNLSCFGIIIWILFAILKPRNKKVQNPQNEGNNKYSLEKTFSIGAFINYMKQLKVEGNSQIDDVIKDLTDKVEKSAISTKVSRESIAPIVQKQTEEKKELDTSNLLLYLGAFVFLFAVFIFASFSWSTFSLAFKVILILFIPFAFFIAGLILNKYKKFESVASTFLLISAFTLGFAGLGIWNFGNFANTISFWEYWLYYSIFIFAAYSGMYRLFSDKKYFYLLLGALYSVVISLSSAFAESTELRIVSFALLNIGVYGLSYLFKERDSLWDSIPSAVNRIIDISVFIMLFSSALNYAENQRLLVLLALFIPFAFDLYQGFIKGKAAETYISLMTLVIRVFMVLSVFDVANNPFIMIISLLILALLVLFEVFKKQIPINLYRVSRNLHLIFLGILTFMTVKWGGDGFVTTTGDAISGNLSQLTLFLVPSIATLGFLVAVSSEKLKPQLGLAFIPLILAIFSHISYEVPVVLMIILALLALTMRIFYSKSLDIKERFGLISIAEVFLFLSMIRMVGDNIQETAVISFGFLIIAVGLVISRYLAKGKYYMFTSFIPVFLAMASLVSYVSEIYEPVRGSIRFDLIGFALPMLFYSLFPFIKCVGRKAKDHAGFLWLGFALFAILASWKFISVALIIQLIAFATSLIFAYKSKNHYWGYVIGILLVIWFRTLADTLGLSTVVIYLVTASVIFVGQSILSFVTKEHEEIISIDKKILQNISYSFMFIAFLHFLNAISWVFNDGIPDHSYLSDMTRSSALLLTSLGLTVSSVSLLNSPLSLKLRKTAGIGFVLVFWNIAAFSDWTTQFFVIPVVIYLAVLAYLSNEEGDKETTKIYELFAALLQGISLLVQSMTGTEGEQLLYGFTLIIISIFAIIFGKEFKRNNLYKLGLVFLILALIIRLWFVVVLLPWWVFLGLIGLALMAAGVYSVSKRKE